jgi:hypothetical protein
MQVIIVLILLVVAFVLGMVLGPAVESGMSMSEQVGQMRDAMGVCGGSNACAAAEGEAAPMTEEAPTEPAPEMPAEEAPAAEPPPQ